MATEPDSGQRLESERRFHNERFMDENRDSVEGFYRVIDDCFADYWSLIGALTPGKKVLEYGCGTGDNALRMAGSCALVHGIDISDVAIEKARARAASEGIGNANFDVMNAEDLQFEDSSFDVIFGSGIIHHLEVSAAYRELARVLRPAGIAIFVEPLGHNPFINGFRRKTPDLRTPDEHPLLRADLAMAEKYFRRVDVDLYGLAALGAIPLLKTGLGMPLAAAGRAADKILLKIPFLKWWAWYSLIKFRKTDA